MSKEKIATERTGTATRPLSTTRMTGTWSGTLHQWYLYTDILYCNYSTCDCEKDLAGEV